jgi:hypothetical protein
MLNKGFFLIRIKMLLTGAKASDGKYVLLFEGDHTSTNCKHTKHVARVLDYTFIFCKETKAPIAIYCGAEIVEDQDVLTLVAELADKYSLMGELVQSPFFDKLSEALLSVEDVNLLKG